MQAVCEISMLGQRHVMLNHLLINKIGKKGVTSTRRVSTKIITDVLGKSLTTAVKLACNPEIGRAHV